MSPEQPVQEPHVPSSAGQSSPAGEAMAWEQPPREPLVQEQAAREQRAQQRPAWQAAQPMRDDPHPAPDSPLDLLRGFALGVVGGSRTVLPLALLAREVSTEGPDIADGGWFLDLFARRRTAFVLGVAALIELIVDKQPMTGARVNPGPLIGRIVSGGTAAAVQALSEGRRSDHGALVGSA